MPIHTRDTSSSGDRRGQALVEFGLILPLVLFLLLGIFDFGRLFSSAVAIESAAREAADYGSLYRWHWTAANTPLTEAEMERRACTAASTLPDYDEPSGTVDHATCTNPDFTYELIYPDGTTIDCSAVPRTSDPCMVKVVLEYQFHVIVPINIRYYDTTLGLPSVVPMTRTSTFAVSDFQIDVEPTTPPSP
ncbi:MAG: pilus assembly protein [Actinomycetota bacterium]|nr:pilus assembly protein [Actinomycetota bacterium]